MKTKGFLTYTAVFLSSLMVATQLFAKGAISYQYFSRLNTPGAEASDSFFEMEIDHTRRKRKSGHRYSLDVRSVKDGAIFAAPEFYKEFYRGATTYSFGRKILNWQGTEKIWGLSDLNAQRGFSHLETKQEGIFAFHFDRRKGTMDYSFFVSPVHVPQLNPTFSNQKGSIKTKNEWGTAPPEFIRFNGVDIPVKYQIIYPNASEVALRPSAGMRLGYKNKKTKVSLYSTFKPENQIRITASGFYDQFGPEGRVIVKAKPFVNYHTVNGVGVEQNIQNIKLASYLDFINPLRGKDESFRFEGLAIEPVYTDEARLSASATLEKNGLRVSTHFLELLKGGKLNKNVFAKKPRWHRAMGLEASYRLNSKFNFSIDMKYDFKMKDSTIKNEVLYRATKHIKLGLGLEVINAPKDESFWAAFRSNDSVYSTFSYLF